jgi:hypothetical protein
MRRASLPRRALQLGRAAMHEAGTDHGMTPKLVRRLD